MESIAHTTSLWKMLETKDIIIPIIQRDYAQGRHGKENLRKKFLGEIKSALEYNKTLLLDFVYATESDGKISPIDGQQRLTTIWLLMWYATYLSDDSDIRNKRAERLKKFSYETRTSSKEFLVWMIDGFIINRPETNGDGITMSDRIQAQSQFYSEWKQDPTVRSILRMLSGTFAKDENAKDKTGKKPVLDGIEQVFNGVNADYFNSLFEDDVDKCPIQFYYLPLNGIRQSDGIYIKMNARGEQLTGFENFKADLVDYLSKDASLNHYVDIQSLSYILKKWDVDWTNMFWKNTYKETNFDSKNIEEVKDIDNLYFAFIKRFLLNSYVSDTKANEITEKDPTIKLLMDESGEYTSFEPYKCLLTKKRLEQLFSVFDNAQKLLSQWHKYASGLPLIGQYSFLPLFEERNKDGKVKTVTRQDMVLMYGICLYLQSSNAFEKESTFGHWLRVLTNLVYYNEIPNFDSYATRIRFVKEVADRCICKCSVKSCFYDIYSDGVPKKLGVLAEQSANENNKQLREELRKIDLITDSRCSEKDLILLESLWIFTGRIDVLLDLLEEQASLNAITLYKKLSCFIGSKTRYLSSSDQLIEFFQTLLALKAGVTGTSSKESALFRSFIRRKVRGSARRKYKSIPITSYRALKPEEKTVLNNHSLPAELILNDEHNRLRFILNDELRDAFKKLIAYNDLNVIINQYRYVEGDWLYALVKDKALWKYSYNGKFKNYNGKYYMFRGSYKNAADIPLAEYGRFLFESKGHVRQIKYIMNNLWKITMDYKRMTSSCPWNGAGGNHRHKNNPSAPAKAPINSSSSADAL